MEMLFKNIKEKALGMVINDDNIFVFFVFVIKCLLCSLSNYKLVSLTYE